MSDDECVKGIFGGVAFFFGVFFMVSGAISQNWVLAGFGIALLVVFLWSACFRFENK